LLNPAKFLEREEKKPAAPPSVEASNETVSAQSSPTLPGLDLAEKKTDPAAVTAAVPEDKI